MINTIQKIALKVFRKKRFKFFLSLLMTISNQKVEILDVGGTVDFWKNIGADIRRDITVTILNTMQQESDDNRLMTMIGDARNMPCFSDGKFDIVFSNSVIEHVGSYEDQVKMAQEIRRIGQNYFVQTPNYYFPIEPHFLFPLFQFLPIEWKIFLVMNFNVGHYKKQNSREAALKTINEIRLLKLNELKTLFPDGKIVKEKFFGFTKSFMVYKFM